MSKTELLAWSAPVEIARHVDRLAMDKQIPAPGRAYVTACLERGPSSPDENLSSAITVELPSKKLRAMIRVKGRLLAHPYAYLLEQNPDVLAFFAEPSPTTLHLRDEAGKLITTTNFSPSFLEVRKDEIALTKLLDEDRLYSSALKNPYQFFKDDNGKWHYRAAEDFFKTLGLGVDLVPSSSIPATLVQNLRFLEDYTRENCQKVPAIVHGKLALLIQEERVVSLGSLLDRGFETDHVFKLVADQEIHFDLRSTILSSSHDLKFFSDRATQAAHEIAELAHQEEPAPIPGTLHIHPGATFTHDGRKFTVLLPGERDVSLRDEQGNVSTLPISILLDLKGKGLIDGGTFRPQGSLARIADYSPKEIQDALERLDAVKGKHAHAYSERSLSRYRTLIEKTRGDFEALMELIDHARDRGNRIPRISEKNESIIAQAVAETFNTPEKRSKKSAYAKYSSLCEGSTEEIGTPVFPVSYPTFCKKVDELRSTRKRSGKRAAYQEQVIIHSLATDYPVAGARPHEICHMDFTTANIATATPDGMEIGKPTLALGIDAHTTQSRAMLVTYDPASAKLVLLLLRDYVRRHKRLPNRIVIDNGPEFRSSELAFFCKIYQIEIIRRRKAQPRDGSIIERLIGASEAEVFQEMQGNTVGLKKDARLVTKSTDPFRHAVWTLYGVYQALEAYHFEVRANRIHPALGRTPKEFEAQRVLETGTREHLLVQFDENIMILTTPHSGRPFHKVDRQRGVWLDGEWYRHPEMNSVRRNEKVEVRVEPWNASVVYVQIGNHWVAAIASNRRRLSGRTRREFEIALREKKRLAKLLANRDTLGAKSLKFKESLWSPELFDPRINAQEREFRYLFNELGMTSAMAIPIDNPGETQAEDGLDRQNLGSPTSTDRHTSGTAESGQVSNPAADTDSAANDATITFGRRRHVTGYH